MPFLLVKMLKQGVILWNPFLTYLKPFTVIEKEIITQGNQRILFKTYYNFEKFSKHVQELSYKNNTKPKSKYQKKIKRRLKLMNDHKSLYKILQWIKYNTPISKNILKRIHGAKSYVKFDIILEILEIF